MSAANVVCIITRASLILSAVVTFAQPLGANGAMTQAAAGWEPIVNAHIAIDLSIYSAAR